MKKIIVTGIITMFVMLSVAAMGWNFSKVTELPEKYVNKTDLERVIERQDKKMDKIDKKLDTLIEHIISRGE